MGYPRALPISLPMADAAPEGPAVAAGVAVGAGGDVDGAANPAVGNQGNLRPDLPPAIPVSQPLRDLQQAQGELMWPVQKPDDPSAWRRKCPDPVFDK